jgi:hypothetical protein
MSKRNAVLYNQKRSTKPCPRQCGNRIDNWLKTDNYISEVDGVLICGSCKGDEDIEATYEKIRNKNGTRTAE